MHPVLHEALSRSPVMPVLVIPEISMAAPLAEALASGGLTVFEITLRTECALEAMVVMKDAVPEALSVREQSPTLIECDKPNIAVLTLL